MIYKKYPIKKVNLIIKNEISAELTAQHLTFRYLSYIKKLKNRNSKNFTYNKKITWTHHMKWYIRYLRESENFFYILKSEEINYGTIGVKKKSDGWHIYSVIRDDANIYKENLMQTLVNGVLQNYIISGNIFCEVIRGNSAIEWYYKLGFELIHETDNSYHLCLSKVGLI